MELAQRPAQRERQRILGLDGLRAIAVLSVVFYHLNNDLPKGGYVGVDIFFVISGFLITTLLVNEYDRNGKIDFKAFWVRRARRLIPALVTVVLVSVALALFSFYFFRGHDLLVGIGRQTLGAMTFSNNWLEILQGTSYFRNNAPLLFVNFWSLAVEEQFYLLWPFVVIFILAKVLKSQYRAAIAASLGIISAVLMAVMYHPGGDATRVYYGTDTHIFGLMFGACLAFIHTNPWYDVRNASPLTHSAFRKVRVILALVLLPVLFVFIFTLSSSSDFTYRGGLVLVSIITALIIAALPGPANLMSMVLETKVLKWVGQRSYGIYLWHWPIILILGTMLPQVGSGTFNWLLFILALFFTFLFSAISYTYLEMPIRKNGFTWLWDNIQDTFDWKKGKLAAVSIVPLLLVGTLVTALFQAPAKTQSEIFIEQAQEAARQAQAAQVAAQKLKTEDAQKQYEQIKAQALALGLSAPPPPDTRPGVPTGDQITAMGDSVMVASTRELMSTFPGIDVDADIGRYWQDGDTDLVNKLKTNAVRPNVIVGLGTNGPVTADQVEKLVKELGDRKIVLVHAFGQRDWVAGNNQVMDDAANKYKNVAVAKWDQAIAGHTDLLAADGIHPGPDGGAYYAKSVADAFVELANKDK